MLGGLHPLPFHVGGGPTFAEKLYNESRSALGPKGAGPTGGLEDSWRKCRALAMSKAASAAERAAMRAFPSSGGEALPIWEALLGVDQELTIGDRIASVTAAFTQSLDAVASSIETRLQEVDATITVEAVDADTTTVARSGQPFQVASGDAHDTSRWPAYSEHAILFVKWPGGVPDTDKRRRVERILNRDLPAWWDWRIYNVSGFYCDGYLNSFCDLTLLG